MRGPDGNTWHNWSSFSRLFARTARFSGVRGYRVTGKPRPSNITTGQTIDPGKEPQKTNSLGYSRLQDTIRPRTRASSAVGNLTAPKEMAIDLDGSRLCMR